jgi:hypothetical protein
MIDIINGNHLHDNNTILIRISDPDFLLPYPKESFKEELKLRSI